MITSFPKLLVDFGRQFIWSPLTVSLKKDHKSEAIASDEVNSIFYCKGEPCNEDIGGSVHCLSAQINQQSARNLTLTDNKCLLTCSQHYPNCDHIIIDTSHINSISPDIQRYGKSLSAPNLTISSDLFENNINKSDVYDNQKSVTLTISDANNALDAIESDSVRSNPCDRLHEIDWFNINACVSDSDLAIDEVKSSNFLLPINNSLTSELCEHSLSDETNHIKESVISRENVLTMNSNSLRAKNETKDEIIENKLINEKMDQSVVLNDYFDCDKCESSSEKPSLLSDRKNVCSRNSRRLIVSDKRLKNAVLDRLKRLARSQSHGRSDLTSNTNLGSRAFVLRTKGLYRNVKRRFSSAHTCVDEETANITIDDININTIESVLDDNIDTSTVTLRHCSSFESIEDSGCGSSIQTSSLSTDSNRSSICTGDDMNGFPSSLFRGPFISHAKAITDCTPCPYYKDALAFKKGDIISIIAKEKSGIWIGMTNGKIGHFKFVNVEEIESNEKHKTHKLNTFNSSANRKETQLEFNYSSDDQKEESIYDALNARLNESNGAMNLTDVIQVIGLSDSSYLNILSINGYNDLKSLAEIGNKDILNEIGINDSCVQHILLNSAQIIGDYIRNPNRASFKKHSSGQKYFLTKRREAVSHSAPTTPAIEISTDFSELFSKLECVSTSSLDHNYDEIQHFSSINTNIRRKNSQTSVEQFLDSNEKYKKENNCDNNEETIYENNDQINIVTHEQHSNTSDTSQNNKSNNLRANKHNKNRISLQFGIRDKSLDRNLLRKLDLKPVYMKDKNISELSRSITGSQSVMDLRTNTANCNEKSKIPLNTLRSKKKLKKLISSSRKFSSFTSHSSLTSLANDCSSNSSTNIVSKTLLEAIQIKLKSENIDLTQEPYSDCAGFCGIPPALLQRYSDECQRDTYEIAEVLDSLRMKYLEGKERRGIPNDYLGDSCMGPIIDSVSYENLHLWLISLSLPMYERCLKNNGYENLYKVSKLREVDIINKCGITDKRHVRILTNAIGALHLSFGDIDKS